MTELAYVYCDLGDQQYKALVHEMVTSARAVMPDVKITQISDSKTPIYPGADALFNAEVDCDKDSICAFKGHFMAEFAMKCKNPLILCDVDLIWQREPNLLPDFCVMTRKDMPSMPINTGFIYSEPGNDELWKSYQEIIDQLHTNGMGGWYSDQIAAAIAWSRRPGVSERMMDMLAYAPTGPDDTGGEMAMAIHLKGDRKKWLRNFAKRGA